jgi:ABC-type spermidine/putrescine transport system permease subunit I
VRLALTSFATPQKIGRTKPALARCLGRRGLTRARRNELGQAMSRTNILYLLVGALCVVVAVLGYQLYEDHKKPEGVSISFGPGGISVDKK